MIARPHRALLAVAAGIVALGPAPLVASPPFSETLQVELVEVEVRVVGRQGRPVVGLGRDLFTVTEDGVAVEIVGFEESGRAGEAARRDPGRSAGERQLPGEPAGLEETVGAATPPGTTVVFFVDASHVQPGSFRRILPAAERFLKGSTPGEQAIVAVHDGGLRIVAGPTADRARVLEALTEARDASSRGARGDLVRRQGYREIVEALRCGPPNVNCDSCWQNAEAVARQHTAEIADSVERSLDSLGVLVASLAGVPGRKTVLLLSDGLAQRPGLEIFDYLAQVCPAYEVEISRNYLSYDAMPAFLRLASKAAGNRTTIWALETRGLEAGGSVQDDFFSVGLPLRPSMRNQEIARTNRQSSLHLLADQTGGLALLNYNDLGEAMARIEEDLAHRYVLAYRPDHPPCGRQHRIAVRVAGARNLRYRESYLHQQSEPRLAELLDASLLYGVESDPIGVTLSVGEPTPAPSGRFVVPLRLKVPLTRIVLLPEEGELVGSLRLVVTGAAAGGERLPIKQKQVPVRLSPEVVEGGEALHHDFQIDVELDPGEWKLAVAVWDELADRVSVLQAEVLVGDER